jgi:hypothetical protein
MESRRLTTPRGHGSARFQAESPPKEATSNVDAAFPLAVSSGIVGDVTWFDVPRPDAGLEDTELLPGIAHVAVARTKATSLSVHVHGRSPPIEEVNVTFLYLQCFC